MKTISDRGRASHPSGLQSVVEALRMHYGQPLRPVETSPFALILWEQVGYLVDDVRRGRAFGRLKAEVGLTPEDVLVAAPSLLKEIAASAGTIALDRRVQRMQASARKALDEWGGDLTPVLDLPEKDAKGVLSKFPMIGGPGAEKILLFARRWSHLPLESNGLRVVTRLGYGEDGPRYDVMYRTAQSAVDEEIPHDSEWLLVAHQLLRQHGQTLCKRSTPRCVACPLKVECPFNQAARSP